MTDALGKKILESYPDDKDVKTKLTQLRADQRIIEELWKKKEANLRDAREMQVGGTGILTLARFLCRLVKTSS